MNDVELYQEARATAARTPTRRLRRQEERLATQARRRGLDDDELARLAAVRAELGDRTDRLTDRRGLTRTWYR